MQQKKKPVRVPGPVPVPVRPDTPEVVTARSIEQEPEDEFEDLLEGPLDVSDYVAADNQKNLGRYMSGSFFDIA